MTQETPQRDYRDTVFLPKTDFPMKAGLPQKEPGIAARWEQIGLYNALRDARRGREKFILHDGPPYANGELHIGHAYVGGGDRVEAPRIKTGLLGAELSRDPASRAYRIEKTLPGENWQTKTRSPLTELGVNVSAGDFILAVDGRPVREYNWSKRSDSCLKISSVIWRSARNGCSAGKPSYNANCC